MAYLDVAARVSARRKREAISGRIEGPRRHGRFDLRGPSRKLGPPQRARHDRLVSHDDAEGLDWDSFSARCFPGARRHVMEATSAYDAYTDRSMSRSCQTGTVARVA